MSRPTDSRGVGRWTGSLQFGSGPENSALESKTIRKRLLAQEVRELGGRDGSLGTAPAVKLERLRQAASLQLAPVDSTGIFRRLLLGETGGPSEALQELGFFHVLTASGLHLYALAALAGLVSKWVAFRAGFSVRGGLWLGRLGVSMLVGWAWLLAGAPWGMLRPLGVYFLRRFSVLGGFRWRRWTPLLAALALEMAVEAAGRLAHLSAFTADAGGGSAWLNRLTYALAVGGALSAVEGGAIRIAIASWLAIAGVQAWRIGLVSLLSPLVSLITVPVLVGILYPVALVSVALSGAPPFASLLSLTAAGGNELVKWLTLLTFKLSAVWSLPAWVWPASLGFSVLAGAGGRRLGVLCVCGVLAIALRIGVPLWQRHAEIRVEQIDVGQGDGALVIDRRTGRTGLVDSGDGKVLDSGKWLKILAREGVTEIDWALLTHLDADHSAGLAEVARVAHVRCVATSEAEAASDRGVKYFNRLADLDVERRSLDRCVPFPTFTAGQSGSRERAGANANMTAILIPFRRGGFYLSPGDAEGPDELEIGTWVKKLEAEDPELAQGPTLLKVGHHGSRTSSAPEFLKEVHPSVAWISSGVGNPYGHPTPEVLARLESLHIPVLRTDQRGELRSP